MTRDDINRMAMLARIKVRGYYDESGSTPQELERFAELVAAAERETCAKVCDDLDGTFFKRRAVKLDKQQYGATDILKIMRDVNAMVTEDCADAIRARGQV